MNGKGLLTALSLALCLSFGAAAQGQPAGLAQGAVMSESFDQASPEGWELLPGAQVQSVEGGSALVCGNGGHGVWVAAQARDLTLRFRYRPGQGAGRVAVSASGEPPNAREYSIVLAPGTIGVDRVTSGQVQTLAGGAVALQPGSWYDVAVQVDGGRISVSVGGQTVVTAVDRQPLGAGAIAFGAIEGSGFAFDNVALMPAGTLPIPLPTPAGPMSQELPAPEASGGSQPGRVQTVTPMPAEQVALGVGELQRTHVPSQPMAASGQVLASSAVPSDGKFYLSLDKITGPGNWIEVHSFEFSIGSSTSAQDWTRSNQGHGAGKTAFGPLMITKEVDLTSPDIYLHCAQGTHLESALLQITDSSGNVRLRIRLWDVRILGVETEGTANGHMSDTFGLSFSRMEWDVKSASGSANSKSWDLAKNAPY